MPSAALLSNQNDSRCAAEYPHSVQNIDRRCLLNVNAHCAPAAARPLIFATWLGAGEAVSSIKIDRSWLGSIKLAHPHAQVIVLTGEEDVITNASGVDMIFRIKYDKKKMGRNPWANYMQYQAQIQFLQYLQSMELQADCVFLDMDIICFDSIMAAFHSTIPGPAPFDYGVCITDDASMPINIGVMFSPGQSHTAAINFLQEVCNVYDFGLTFTAGQVAIAQFCQLWQQPESTYQLVRDTMQHTRTLRQLPGTLQPSYTVAYFSSLQYNFCKTVTVLHYEGAPETVVDNAGNIVNQAAAPVPRLHLHSHKDLHNLAVKFMHFVGARKPAMQCVYKGLLEEGVEGGYKVLAELPDLEQDYAAVAAKLGCPAFDPYDEKCLVWGAEGSVLAGDHTSGGSVASTTSEVDLMVLGSMSDVSEFSE